jgi:hypothetical protein
LLLCEIERSECVAGGAGGRGDEPSSSSFGGKGKNLEMFFVFHYYLFVGSKLLIDWVFWQVWEALLVGFVTKARVDVRRSDGVLGKRSEIR